MLDGAMTPDETTRHQGPRYATLGTAGIFVGALAYIGLRDPHAPGFGFPPCPFRLLTGWNCPGCGGLRMTHDLLHGDIGAAIVDNAFLLVGLPLLALWMIIRWRGGRTLMPKPAIVLVIVAAVMWTVVRNLPGFPLVPTLIGG
ncbi:membrane protein [Mycobacterium antarcticum]|nr:membrane protein [Mycolicibacterium sp. TUM20983]GLP83950.1 membrane protein [Mycolicibacterium sp. TUM20984]